MKSHSVEGIKRKFTNEGGGKCFPISTINLSLVGNPDYFWPPPEAGPSFLKKRFVRLGTKLHYYSEKS